jgi:ABC-type amino acid transport substrate-binding protein
MMMRLINIALYRVFFKALIIILLIPVSQTSYAETLKFGVFKIEPWGILIDGNISGINWQQAQIILSKTSFTAQPILSNYPRMIKQLAAGKTHCSIFTINPDSAENFNMVAFLYDLTVVAISRKGIEINSMNDLKNRKIIKTIGFANGTDKAFQEVFYDPSINSHVIPSPAQGPLLLAKKRIDAFIGIKRTMLYAVDKANAAPFISYPWYEIKKLPVWLQCSKKSNLTKVELEELKKAAIESRDNGELDEIIKKWIKVS